MRFRPLVLALLIAAAPPARSADPELSESERAFHILGEVMREIEDRSLTKLTRDEIFRGFLRALTQEVPEARRNLIPSAAGLKGDLLLDTITGAAKALADTGEPALQPLPIISATIHRFLQTELDIHCGFVNLTEAAALTGREGSVLVGVGLSLEEPEPGVLRCYPYPGESADLAGIEQGEWLVAVDGKPVAGLSRFTVAIWFSGEDGTELTVRLRNEAGAEREVTLRRRLLSPPLLEVTEDAGGIKIRIRKFRAETARELEKILARTPGGRRLIFDLRGSKGGELEAAVDCAAQLLPKGSEIATIRGRGETETYLSPSEAPYHASRIVLLQDGGTASAAELFIAALIGNPQINTINEGTKTYGKATVQLVIPLEFGGILKLTIRSITGPGDLNWEGEGILPRSETLPDDPGS